MLSIIYVSIQRTDHPPLAHRVSAKATVGSYNTILSYHITHYYHIIHPSTYSLHDMYLPPMCYEESKR